MINKLPHDEALHTPPDLSKYPMLDSLQAGHIRHINNLSSTEPGKWSTHYMTEEPFTGQEFLDALRYQIATMSYAISVAHYHRLPALRSVFKPVMRNLIAQMLRKEVWGYWFNTSMSGIRIDPDLKELRKPWADPCTKENIMYSGHLLLMTSLYGMLFDDDEFEKEGSIVFHWDPIFWGMGPETFQYSNRTLQDAILKEMEANGWVGVCCEPNMVFVVCNQFPLIAMRYNDIRDHTNKIDDILVKYLAAWGHRGGMPAADGYVRDAWMVKQANARDAKDWAFSAWNAAFMHAWNADYVEKIYPSQALGNIVKIADAFNAQQSSKPQYIINTPEVATTFRKLVAEGKLDPLDPATQQEAVRQAKVLVAENAGKPKFPYKKPAFGYAVQSLSELPQPEARDALSSILDYAQMNLNPTWENGGLYYPHQEEPFNDEMEWTLVSPYDGNASIAYARLNVVNGQKMMWEQPWTKESLAQRPWIDGVSLADGVDFLRGTWDEAEGLLFVTMKRWNKTSGGAVNVIGRNLDPGEWEIWIGEQLYATEKLSETGTLSINVVVGSDAINVIFRKL